MASQSHNELKFTKQNKLILLTIGPLEIIFSEFSVKIQKMLFVVNAFENVFCKIYFVQAAMS